ncbi:MAG: cyclase [Blastocatellia bacterium]|nr:MAG: cyclase [Blastocatellia bacterium]
MEVEMTHQKRRLSAVALAAIAGTGLAARVAIGQSDRWYPSRWGADDQRGAANRITPSKVLQAKELIKQGRIYQLGRVYEAGMPLPATRHYSLHIPQAYVTGGKNQGIYHDEVISGEIGQIGTQFDGLGHFGIGDLFYNGNRRADFAQPGGLTRLGIENVGAIFTRGVLIDVARLRGTSMLEGGYEITVDDLKNALARERVGLGAGDVVLIHTGWGSLWMKDNARYLGSAPGIGLAAAQFLADSEVTVVGSDNSAVEVSPNPDKDLSVPVHQLLLTRNGIYLHENLATEELARDAVYEFAYVFSPLRLKGATGSPGNPIGIR